jgi:hypothetical protein
MYQKMAQNPLGDCTIALPDRIFIHFKTIAQEGRIFNCFLLPPSAGLPFTGQGKPDESRRQAGL